jgi:hypothetical protein
MSILSDLGPIGSVFGLISSENGYTGKLYEFLEGQQTAEETSAFRSAVLDQLAMVNNQLSDIETVLNKLMAQVKWQSEAAVMTSLDSDITTAWKYARMDTYLQEPTPANAAQSTALLNHVPNIDDFPFYLLQYNGLMAPDPGTTTSILDDYIQYIFATIPADQRPQSVCEMAYAFWAHIANQQFRAFTMYVMYIRTPAGDGTFTYKQDLLKGWNPGDSPLYPEMQAQAAQQIVDSYVQNDVERIQFTCAMPPRQTTTNPASTTLSPGPVAVYSVIESGLFFKNALEQGTRLIPEGEVLATWHFYAEWDSGAVRFGNMGPVLYSGTLNPETGMVSKTDSNGNPLPLTRTVLQYDKAAGDAYIDPNPLIVFENNDASNGARTLDYASTPGVGPQVGCWSLLTLESPDGSVLTGISNVVVARGPTFYSDSNVEMGPANGEVIGLEAQFVGAEDSGTTGATLTSLVGHPAPDLSQVIFAEGLDYPENQPDLQRSQFLTFTGVGMDLSQATTDIYGQLQSEINPAPGATPTNAIPIAQSMPVMTGVGLSTYTNPTGAGQIVTPVNLYAYHLKKFGPASASA